MKKEEIEGLVKLRKYMIEYYKTLDGGQASGTAVTLQRDVALVLETVVREMDDLLSEYVRFE
tara:strand:- start:105 stop:290 length:186 start_codon:yes stop_codon:yes gene_type:complete